MGRITFEVKGARLTMKFNDDTSEEIMKALGIENLHSIDNWKPEMSNDAHVDIKEEPEETPQPPAPEQVAPEPEEPKEQPKPAEKPDRGKYVKSPVREKIKLIISEHPEMSVKDLATLIEKELGIDIHISTIYKHRRDSKPQKEEVEVSEPSKPTMLKDRDEIADTIMDLMLDTVHMTRRDITYHVFGTHHPKSEEKKAITKALNTLTKFYSIGTDESGVEPTWHLTEEGEEIAKNKRAMRGTKP